MAKEHPLNITMSNTENISFKNALKGYYAEINESQFVVGCHELGLKASGNSLRNATISFKEMFCDLAEDLYMKTKSNMALSGKEREKYELIQKTCIIN